MIKMALPNKGQLFEPTIELLKACGYKAKKSYRSLSCIDEENQIEFYFLRPSDIPMYVSEGIIDVGITGKDFDKERKSQATNIMDLNYGHSKLCVAAPKDSDYKTHADLQDVRIATSFPEITTEYLKGQNIKIVELDGAVEISVNLGVSDVIVDVVETGSTLKQAGLAIIGDPIYRSNAAVFVHPGKEDESEIQRMKKRIEGKILATQYKMVEYDAPKEILEEVCQLTPGIESPTITPLKSDDWYSVKSLIKNDESNILLDKLSEKGCKGIILSSLETIRI